MRPRSVPPRPRLGALCLFKVRDSPFLPCNGPAGGREQGEGEREEASQGKGERAWGERGDEAVAAAMATTRVGSGERGGEL